LHNIYLFSFCSLFQDSLITGFQKENERLSTQLRDREAEESYRAAKFYDERDRLNKELNRLRNIVGFDVKDLDVGANASAGGGGGSSSGNEVIFKGIGVHRTSDMIRADFEKESLIEHLKEKIEDDKLEYSMRAQELQATIDKLRTENKRLENSSRTNEMKVMEHLDLKASLLALQSEKRRLLEDAESMREKIRYILKKQKRITIHIYIVSINLY